MPRSTALRTSVACRFCENLSCSRTVCHQRPRPKIGRARVEFKARQPRACVDSRRSRTCVDRQPTQRRQHLVQLLRAVVDSLDLFPLLQRETRTPRTGSAPRARAGARHWSGSARPSPGLVFWSPLRSRAAYHERGAVHRRGCLCDCVRGDAAEHARLLRLCARHRAALRRRRAPHPRRRAHHPVGRGKSSAHARQNARARVADRASACAGGACAGRQGRTVGARSRR